MSNKKIFKKLYKNKINKQDNYKEILRKINIPNKKVSIFKKVLIPICSLSIVTKLFLYTPTTFFVRIWLSTTIFTLVLYIKVGELNKLLIFFLISLESYTLKVLLSL